MAQITLNIPDEHLQRVQDAGVTKQWVYDQIREQVRKHEIEQAQTQARANLEQAEQAYQTALDNARQQADNITLE